MNNRLVVSLCVLLSACASAVGEGYFTPTAFYQSEFPYRVRFAQENSFLGGDWVLDNFYPDRRNRLKPKETNDYVDNVPLDLNGDDVNDEYVQIQVFDVRLLHRRTNAALWISHLPLPVRWAETDLSVVARSYVEAASGVGVVVTSLGVSSQRRYSTRVVSERALTVWNRPAYEVAFEVANVDQLELSDASRTRMVRVLLVRPPYGWHVRGDVDVPVLTVVGMSTLPEQFEATSPYFVQLVNQVDQAYDDALKTFSARVVACLPGAPAVDAEIDVAADGEIKSVGRVRGTADPPRMRRHAKERRCAQQILEGQRVAATGLKRTLTWRFAPTDAPSGAPAPYALATPPPPAPVTATEAPSLTPTQTAPLAAWSDDADATTEASGPVATPQDTQAALRAAIIAKKDAIVACVGQPPLAISVRYSAGTVTTSLRRPLAGTPEEQCVQHVLRDLTAPATATGTLIHVIE